MKDFKMLDLSNDKNYENVKIALIYYFNQYLVSEEKRKSAHIDDVAFSVSVRAYDKMCVAHDKFYKELGAYINNVTNLEDKKYLAGHFIFKVMDIISKEKDSKRKNLLKKKGLHIISNIVENYPLSERTRKSIDKYVKKNRAQKKLTDKALEKLTPKRYKNPIEGLEGKDVVPSYKTINEYVSYAYNCALDYNNTDISAHSIFDLLKKNTSMNGIDVIQPTIFEEAKKIKAINKEAVLEVAKTYADNIDIESNYYGENNQAFDRSMEKMFCHIVTTYGYNPKEVEELKQTLIDNSQDREFSKRMAQNIGASYITSMQNMKARNL